ncbi:DEAD/DEAH box helicase [Tenacibaculum sp. SZ-18]|uniref:RecQ family ATP-dependent DNA helicase n=1 Tax=Tenacibaculum sp. SZ-18 TaxID=754423 RepID=UPI000C2CF55E|nr:RecQ family ATP-dependent DNA helicase [Tenacibaculum sp. SZ-18]AUC14806.1 DEAD/DEAH box helicase [Tenacibaculum sp. SZ-18]
MSKPKDLLKEYWGFSSFRPKQQEIVDSILDKNDTVALLPTGGGKSIAFQVPGLVFEGVCIVVSPLIALIEDQVSNLKDRGIKATQIPSGSSTDDIVRIFDNIKYGGYKFLYLSPERIQTKLIQEKLNELPISLIVIDEAHCISEWGQDFRPSYTKLNILRKLAPEAKIVALTATATKKVLTDIVTILELENPTILQESFYKENLSLNVIYTNDKLTKLHRIFEKNQTPSIVYVTSRKRTKELSKYLNQNGFKSGYYHGGLNINEKKDAFDSWMSEEKPIMVATNAFGMGIDKANVGLVVHYNIPASLENYVQEAGRAGRNKKQAFALMLTNDSDIQISREILKRTQPSIQDLKEIHKKLYQHFQISLGESNLETYKFNILEFCNKYNFIPAKAFGAFQILNNYGIIEFNQGKRKTSTIQFLISSNQLIHYKETNHLRKKIIDIILRMYAGSFENEVKINEFEIATNANITSFTVIEILEKLENEGIIKYQKTNTDSEIVFLVPREDDKTINRISKNVFNFMKHRFQKADNMISYIENKEVCRSIQILNYFGEKYVKACGHCDVCLNKKKTHKKDVSINIINLLNKNQPLSLKDISGQLHYTENDILIHLRKLIAEEIISITNTNTYFLN